MQYIKTLCNFKKMVTNKNKGKDLNTGVQRCANDG